MLKETAAPLNGFFILISERMKDKTGHRYPPHFLSISKNKNISFYIHTSPHRHTTTRIPYRRPHSSGPLGPRRNPILLFARLFLVFLSLLTNEKAGLSNLPSFVYDHIPSLICELRVDDLANHAQQSLHRGSPSGLL